MRAIHRDLLAAVCGGGDSSTSITVGPVSAATSVTDYKACLDRVTQLTAQQYKDTRLWLGPFAFGTDTNEAPRAEATLRNIGSICGPPP